MKGIINKVIEMTIIVVLILGLGSLSSVVTYFTGGRTISSIENPHGFVALGVRPNGETMSYPENDSDTIIAVYLYNNAALLAKTSDYFTAYSACDTLINVSGSENKFNLDTVVMKTQSEYFKATYRIENYAPLLNASPSLKNALNESLDMVVSERSYSDREKLTNQKVRNASYSDKGVPTADWSTPTTIEVEAPSFYGDAQDSFQFIPYTISVDTISESTVNYCDDGTIEISLVMDINNPDTAPESLADVKKGSGDKNASFEKNYRRLHVMG